MDQNWHELANALNLPRECRTWIKELQTVRNKWAHLSAGTMPDSEMYRDADTLGRLLTTIGAAPTSLQAVESAKSVALAAMAGAGNGRAGDDAIAQPQTAIAPIGNTGSQSTVTVASSAGSRSKNRQRPGGIAFKYVSERSWKPRLHEPAQPESRHR